MNVMQMQMHILKKNNFGHKRLKELTKGPCQTDSLRLNLLHPNSFRCKLGVGISIWIGPNFSASMGIKVKNLYQFMDECYRILYFWHKNFLFGSLLWSLQLKTIWPSMPRFTTKMTKPLRFVMFLASRLIGILRFRLT